MLLVLGYTIQSLGDERIKEVGKGKGRDRRKEEVGRKMHNFLNVNLLGQWA